MVKPVIRASSVLLQLAWCCHALVSTHLSGKGRLNPTRTLLSSKVPNHETDVVVVGSGLAGLCCGALLAHNGVRVSILESHDSVGGAIHTWERGGFHFESGPSLYSGFSQDRSPNPLRGIFDIVGESPEWLTYDRWGTVVPEGRFAAKLGLSAPPLPNFMFALVRQFYELDEPHCLPNEMQRLCALLSS